MATDLIGPDGRKYTLDNEDPKALDDALKSGFRVETPEAPQTFSESAMETALDVAPSVGAAGVGALQGVSAGTFRATLPKADQQRLAKLEGEHPIASGAGELGGMLVSPINAVGELVAPGRAATVAGRIGQGSLKGAAVGSLFGAGQTVSDASLGDTEMTADKVLAHVGLGALLGAAGGGLGSAIEEGVSGVVSKLSKSTNNAQGVLDELADNTAITSTKANQQLIQKLGEERVSAAAKTMRNEGLLGSTPQDILGKAEKRISEVGAEKGNILELAEAGGAKPDKLAVLKRLDEMESGLNSLQRKSIGKDLGELRDALSGPEGDSFKSLDDLRQSVAKRGKFSSGPAGVDDEALALKRQLAGTLRDEIDRQLVPQLGSDIGKHWGDTKALYGSLKDVATLAKKGASYSKPSGVFGLGLYDLLTGIAGGAVHPLGFAAALGSKFMREYGPGVIAKTADKVAKSASLATVARSFANTLPVNAPKLGSYGPALLNALAQSPEHALATHMVLAQVDPTYSSTAQLAGLTPESPVEHTAALTRAHSLVEMKAAAQETDKAIDRHLAAVFRGSGSHEPSNALAHQDFGMMRMRRGAEASHEKRADEIRQLAADPNALVERISQNLQHVGPVAPAVSAQLTNRAANAVQYLAQACAVPPKPGPLAHDWVTPEADRHDFAQKLEVVEDPLSVLRHASSGALTEGQVEALRAVYPRLAQEIADRALMKLTESPARVPYSARLMVNMLTGVDPDGTFSGEAIAANQTAIASGMRREAQGSQGVPKAADEMSLAQRTATPTQRREFAQE
jgi:hypothetical protein